MAAIQIGWELATQELAIKQGSSGAVDIVATLSDDAGVDYNDWTCRIVFLSPFNGRDAITLTPAVVGDAGAKTLTATMTFVPDTTAALAPGVYSGDVKFSSAQDSYFARDLVLTIEESAA